MAKILDKLYNRIIEGELVEISDEELSNLGIAKESDIVSALEGQDIAPKDVSASGNITGASIIENMSGYAFGFASTVSEITITPIYNSCCKNGNKITFVWFNKVVRTGALNNSYAGIFDIPSSIGSKLYPTINNYLYIGGAFAMKSDTTTQQINFGIEKVGGLDKVGLVLRGLTSLSLNEEYTIRIEATFLLSDDMTPSQE